MPETLPSARGRADGRTAPVSHPPLRCSGAAEHTHGQAIYPGHPIGMDDGRSSRVPVSGLTIRAAIDVKTSCDPYRVSEENELLSKKERIVRQ